MRLDSVSTTADATLRLRSERLEWRRVDGDASTCLCANGSAAPLWEALAEGTTRDDLIVRLVGAAGIDRDRAARDIDDSSASWLTVGSSMRRPPDLVTVRVMAGPGRRSASPRT